MNIAFTTAASPPDDADVLAVLVADGGGARPPVDPELLQRLGFKAKAGTTQVLSGTNGGLVAVAGLGPVDGLDEHTVRRAGAALARALERHPSVAVDLGDAGALDGRAAGQALGEGFALGAYSYDRFKSDPEPSKITTLTVVSSDPAMGDGLERAGRLADAVCWARDLANTPGGTLTPEELAAAAVEMAEREGLEVHVLDHDAIVEARLGGLLGVN